MTKLFPYQREDVERINQFHGQALIANEPGTGKTLEALTWLVENKAFPVIVVCPASIKWNWEREAEIHYGLRCEILSGRKGKQIAKIINKEIIWIINYDILQGWVDFLLALQPKTIIFDEIHYLKSMKAKRTKTARLLSRNIPYRLGLSGTPLTNRPAELFSSLNILRPDLYPAFYPFATQYCCLRKTPWGWDYSGARDLKGLHERLSRTMMIRRKKEDVLKDLPTKVRHIVPLPLENKGEYQEAVHNFLNWLKEESPETAHKAEKAERIVQLGHLRRLAAKLKLKAVHEWIDSFLEESEEKIIVACCHRFMIRSLLERYGKIAVMVDGSVSSRDRKIAFEKFTKNPKCRMFLGNIQAAGVGWNGTVAGHMAFAELPWTPGELTQMEDRCNRIGQTKHSIYHYLIAHDTIEEDLCKILQKKQKILDNTLDGGDVQSTIDIYDQLTKTLRDKRR